MSLTWKVGWNAAVIVESGRLWSAVVLWCQCVCSEWQRRKLLFEIACDAGRVATSTWRRNAWQFCGNFPGAVHFLRLSAWEQATSCANGRKWTVREFFYIIAVYWQTKTSYGAEASVWNSSRENAQSCKRFAFHLLLGSLWEVVLESWRQLKAWLYRIFLRCESTRRC